MELGFLFKVKLKEEVRKNKFGRIKYIQFQVEVWKDQHFASIAG